VLLSDFLTDSIAWSPEVDDRLLIAGDESAIATIETLLATLPAKARGQVFVEVQSDSDVSQLTAPGRVVICWLVRDRGQSLRRSVDAWLSEMLPVEFDREHSIYAWIAAEGRARLLTSN
jgi:NADPH-dependent ferric siderophore reductase